MKKAFIVSPQLNKRLISTLMSSKSNNSPESYDFSLKSTTEFAARSGDVFGKLEVLEKKHEAWVSENETIKSFEEPNALDVSRECETFKKPLSACQWKRKKLEQDAGKSGQVPNFFKKPYPVKQKSSVPQFKLQPRKWKKYSLENIPLSSDATNTVVALQFIDEIRKHKEQPALVTTENSEKLIFNKHLHKKQKTMPDSTLDPSPHVPLKCTVSSEVDLISSQNKSKSMNVTLAHLQEDSYE